GCDGWGGETARNRSMYGPPGRAYVYFIYGNHWCVNAVCSPAGRAEAVLIRAIEATHGEDLMRTRRSVKNVYELTNGPAKLCEALAIDGKLDGIDLSDVHSPLFIARNPELRKVRQQLGPAIPTTRVGISRAEHLPLRFYLAASPFVSRGSSVRHLRNR